jgi:hypothetical protein
MAASNNYDYKAILIYGVLLPSILLGLLRFIIGLWLIDPDDSIHAGSTAGMYFVIYFLILTIGLVIHAAICPGGKKKKE